MSKDYPCGQGPVKWVSTGWLEENLHNRELMVLDVQPSIHDYVQEHLPGAVYVSEGLQAGEMIVTSPIKTVTDGTRVRIGRNARLDTY